MATGSFRTLRLLPLVLAAGLVLTACGSSSTSAPAPAVPAASSSASASDPNSMPSDVTGAGDLTASGETTGAGDTSDQNAMSPVDAKVRIANTYLSLKGQQPTAIDVWAGTPTSGGKKLLTVPYGTVSDYFAPLTQDPAQSQRYTLNFYPAGSTAEDTSLGDDSETGAAGLKLTVLIAPVDPTEANTDSLGTTFHTYTDAVSAKPGSSGFTTPSMPTPAAGKSVLLLDASALRGRAGLTQESSGLTPSSTDGKCLPYYETNPAGSGFSSTLHDMTSDTIETFGGTGGKPYQVSPGSPVRINQPKADQLITAACADKPVFGPFDPKLAAGQRAYGIMYGADLTHTKILLVPVG